MSRKELIEKAKERGIIYAKQMTKEQLRYVLLINEKDPSVRCLPEVEKKFQDYREKHRERACETSRRWRRNNPEKAKAYWDSYNNLTEIGKMNWGARKCDRVAGECWKRE